MSVGFVCRKGGFILDRLIANGVVSKGHPLKTPDGQLAHNLSVYNKHKTWDFFYRCHRRVLADIKGVPCGPDTVSPGWQ